MFKPKTIIDETLMISFLILIVISIEEFMSYFFGDGFFTLAWYQPLAIVLVSMISSLPSALLMVEKKITKREWHLRIVFHFLATLIIVLGGGYVFGWYDNSLKGISMITIAFIVVYLCVWGGSLLLIRYEENMINSALEKIRDDD